MANSSRSNAPYLVSAGCIFIEKKASGYQCPSMHCSSDAPTAVDDASTGRLVVAACRGCTRSVAEPNALLDAVNALVI